MSSLPCMCYKDISTEQHKVVTFLRIVQFTQLLSRNICVCHKLFIYSIKLNRNNNMGVCQDKICSIFALHNEKVVKILPKAKLDTITAVCHPLYKDCFI